MGAYLNADKTNTKGMTSLSLHAVLPVLLIAAHYAKSFNSLQPCKSRTLHRMIGSLVVANMTAVPLHLIRPFIHHKLAKLAYHQTCKIMEKPARGRISPHRNVHLLLRKYKPRELTNYSVFVDLLEVFWCPELK